MKQKTTSEMKSFLLTQMSDDELGMLINNIGKFDTELVMKTFGLGLTYIIRECMSERRLETKNEEIIRIQDLVVKKFSSVNDISF